MYIYYIHNAVNKQGYIGQAQDDDGRRIIQHIQKAEDEGYAKDGAARLIRQVGLQNIRYTIYPDTHGYGLPAELWPEFFKIWSYNGKTSWDACSAEEQLDLAEMMHTIWAKLTQSKTADFNSLIGGFQSNNGSATLRLVAADIIEQLHLTQPYTITRFQLDTHNNKKAWRRITDPLAYLSIRDNVIAPLNEWIQKSQSEVWEKIFKDRRMKAAFVELFLPIFEEEFMMQSPKPKTHTEEIEQWRTTLIETVKTISNDSTSKWHQQLSSIIRKNVKALAPEVKSNIDFQLNQIIAEKLIAPLIKRIHDLSVGVWYSIYNVFKVEAAKKTRTSASISLSTMMKSHAVGRQDQYVKLLFSNKNMALDFDYKKSAHEATWVQILRSCKLGV